MNDPYTEGYAAYENELSIDDNPYDKDTQSYEYWEDGWYEAYDLSDDYDGDEL